MRVQQAEKNIAYFQAARYKSFSWAELGTIGLKTLQSTWKIVRKIRKKLEKMQIEMKNNAEQIAGLLCPKKGVCKKAGKTLATAHRMINIKN